MGEVKKIQVEAKHGRKQNQKMKPYVVLQYLMKETDENHLVTAYDIAGYLEACGIDAERRSIYKDIEEINKAVLMMEEEFANHVLCDLVDAINFKFVAQPSLE